MNEYARAVGYRKAWCRGRAVVVALSAALLVTATVALAANPSNNGWFDGISKRGIFGVLVNTLCSKDGPTCADSQSSKTNAVLMTVQVGNRPFKACSASNVHHNYLTSLKHGRFEEAVKGFTVSGYFTTKTRLTGKIIAPKTCGGTDTYVATPGSPETPVPPNNP